MNLLRRAFRKYRMSGIEPVISEAQTLIYRDQILSDLFVERWFDRLETEGRLLTRPALRDRAEWTVDPTPPDSDIVEKGSLHIGEPFANKEMKALTAPLVASFPNGRLLGPVGLGTTENGALIADTIARPENTTRRLPIGIGTLAAENGVRRTRSALFGSGPAPTRRVERASAILPLWNNYYHWTVECLPRLRSLEQYAAETGTRPTVFIPSEASGWMREWLSILGWEADVEPLSNEVIEAEQLVVTSHPEPIPADCTWLRDRGLEAVDRDDDSSSRRIFISRTDATRRRVSNRARLDPLLEEFGFESYVLGELTVTEQIELFSEAEIVLAPHGAGLTNVLFGSDLSVVELFGPKKNTTFYRLADLCGHEYRSLECPSDGIDIDVDLNVLRTVLEQLTE
ncbi:DUF563 domain-containing protein [Natrinema pallidum]|uniref:Glycosyltransferase family 61 protein n=1 Tax=Natrinema pallidum TaxID=69527 RepID=A0A4P9TFX4_9EURY|nr:glycosyltransferase family 61 protein [Natrinema pallidum]QCW02752.1 glycosyltransferase family 61 protein [Natrinema pallidum]